MVLALTGQADLGDYKRVLRFWRKVVEVSKHLGLLEETNYVQ